MEVFRLFSTVLGNIGSDSNKWIALVIYQIMLFPMKLWVGVTPPASQTEALNHRGQRAGPVFCWFPPHPRSAPDPLPGLRQHSSSLCWEEGETTLLAGELRSPERDGKLREQIDVWLTVYSVQLITVICTMELFQVYNPMTQSKWLEIEKGRCNEIHVEIEFKRKGNMW